MLKFEYTTIEDREWLQPILSQCGFMGSEHAFGTLFLWNGAYHSKVCRQDGYLYLCSGEHEKSYNFPLPDGPEQEGGLKRALETLLEDAKEKNCRFQMWGMTQKEIARMEEVMPDTFEFSLDRDGSDYIYSCEELINLAGRKFHGKRNHLSQFNRSYQFTYKNTSVENLDDCRTVAREWCKENGCSPENGRNHEICALERAFNNYEALHLAGGLIYIEDKPVAFTLGEEINCKEFLLHFEKALPGYNGLYAAINHEFAAENLGKYEYVNREEDMGIEGLRKAKLSYNPVILLQKYRAVLK